MRDHDGTTRESEVANKVQRYEHALELVLRQRPALERTAPITDAEHQLAMQVAENVSAYELGLRERRVPEKAVTPDKGSPAPEAAPAGSAARHPAARKRPRRKAPRAAPQESPARAAQKAARG